jgi:RNA polymerase sigma-70 factor (ECF subfamily)
VQTYESRAGSDVRAEFLTTHWSQVLLAGGEPSSQATEALETLCRAYWSPLYAYARRDGLSPHDAQDVVQNFIAHLIERKDFANVAPEKGRFRSFLLAALKNFLISQARADRALKRGGDRPPLSLHDMDPEIHCEPELTEDFTPDKAFDRRWARTVMARALETLRAEHQSSQQARLVRRAASGVDGWRTPYGSGSAGGGNWGLHRAHWRSRARDCGNGTGRSSNMK